MDSWLITSLRSTPLLETPKTLVAPDFKEGVLRPSHYTSNISLTYNAATSSGVTLHETGTITLPYTEKRFIVQPYASRVENVNPFNVFAYIGSS